MDIPRREASRYISSPEGDSCFSIYQIRWIKNASSISSSETFAKRRAIFLSVLKTSEYPWIFRVTGANQSARKLLSTDLVNTNNNYYYIFVCLRFIELSMIILMVK